MKGWRMEVKNTQVKVYRWEATKGTVRDRKIAKKIVFSTWD